MNSGESLIFGMPIQTCLMLVCQHQNLKDVNAIKDISAVADFLSFLPADDVIKNGGFYIRAKSGQGVVAPPLYMIGQMNGGILRNRKSDWDKDPTADIMELWLNVPICVHFSCHTVDA